MKKLVRSVENNRPVPLNVSDFSAPFYLSPNQRAELFISDIEQVSAVKTIEDAVIALNGKIPDENEQGCFRSLCAAIYYVEGDSGIRLGSFEEFEAEAKRLGYINGYRWGVEYPTNGKRPDLPDDLWVMVCDWCQQDVGAINWSEEIKFKITDSNLKPADTSYLNAPTKAQSLAHSEEGLTHSEWWDYENAKFLSNPSVGSSILCSCSNDGHGVVMDKFAIPVNVVAIHDGKIVVCRQDGKTYFSVSRSEIAPLDHATRKAELERKALIEKAYVIHYKCADYEDFCEKLIDAGWRPKVEK